MSKRLLFSTVSSLGLFAAIMAPAALSEEAATSSDDWSYKASIYLWASGIEGTTVGGSTIDLGFDDLLGNIDFAFMADFEARNGQWSFLGDLVHMDVGNSDNGTIRVNPGPGSGAPVDVGASVGIEGWILSFLGGYTLQQTERGFVDLIGGLRYLSVDTALDGQLSAGPVSQPVSVRADGSVWDVVVGVRGRSAFDERWFGTYHADLGAGESDLVWQLAAGVGYAFDWGEMAFSYRHMEWDLDDTEQLTDINFSGPLLSVGFRF